MLKKIMLLVAVCSTVSMSACLPDNSDPDKSTGTGQITGAFYASGLGSIALEIQNAIVSQSDWFSHVTSGQVDLAAMHIATQGMGAPVKSYVCPISSDPHSGVKQITWIDGRDGSGKFSVHGIGTDGGSIVGALRNRVAGDQVGLYSGGSQLALVDGSTFTFPAGCASAQIPVGAPVLAFTIDRPAAPTAEMARTEYRTVSCGNDASGRPRRGTKIETRTVKYMADGTFTPADANSGWNTETMGQCVDDVVVQVTNRDFLSGQSSADLSNFAGLALADLLSSQMSMNCSKATVTANMSSDNGGQRSMSKSIDTCPLMMHMVTQVPTTDTDRTDNADTKILQCEGMTPLMIKEFYNLYGVGVQTTVWTYGTAKLVRTLDNRNVDAGQQAKRYKWLGTDINCQGYQTFYASCGIIPGNPPVEGRHQGNKWNVGGLSGYHVHSTWLNNLFGVCWFGSCTKVTGGEVTTLNSEYFTGTDQLQNNGNTTIRNMGAFSWDNNELFIPHSGPTGIWRIQDNQCVWQQRVMIANCPFVYDASQQGNWAPQHVSAVAARPAALDPGISGNGSDSSNIYVETRQQGYLTALVVLHWEKCDIKGCDHWDEPYGPGTGSYIKAWNGTPPTNLISLTAQAVAQRNDMCQSIDYQLNANSIMNQNLVAVNNAQSIINNATAVRNAAQAQANAGYSNLAQANQNLANVQAAVTAHYNNAAYWDSAVAHAYDTYYAMSAANTNYANSYHPNCNSKGCTYPPYSPPYSDAQVNSAYYTGYNNAATYQYYADSERNAAYATQAQVPAYQQAVVDWQNYINSMNASVATANSQIASAQNDYTTSLAAYQQAKAVNDQHLQHPLSQAEIQGLQTVQTQTCTSSSGVLDENSQIAYKQTCDAYYANPGAYTSLPSLAAFCTTTFNRDGNGTLSFISNANSMYGGDVQTTLLNTEGVELGWRPQLEGNATPGATTALVTRQKGFADPLMCARSEYEYIQWPIIQYYYQCGGKGGCHVASYYSSRTITKSTVREWSGLSYETGTWSNAQTIYITPWGNMGDLSGLPNPYPTW